MQVLVPGREGRDAHKAVVLLVFLQRGRHAFHPRVVRLRGRVLRSVVAVARVLILKFVVDVGFCPVGVAFGRDGDEVAGVEEVLVDLDQGVRSAEAALSILFGGHGGVV